MSFSLVILFTHKRNKTALSSNRKLHIVCALPCFTVIFLSIGLILSLSLFTWERFQMSHFHLAEQMITSGKIWGCEVDEWGLGVIGKQFGRPRRVNEGRKIFQIIYKLFPFTKRCCSSGYNPSSWVEKPQKSKALLQGLIVSLNCSIDWGGKVEADWHQRRLWGCCNFIKPINRQWGNI